MPTDAIASLMSSSMLKVQSLWPVVLVLLVEPPAPVVPVLVLLVVVDVSAPVLLLEALHVPAATQVSSQSSKPV